MAAIMNSNTDLQSGSTDARSKDGMPVDTPVGIASVVQRLRDMMGVLEDKNTTTLPVEEFKNNLEFAVKVLTECYTDEQKRLNEQDDELPDAEPHDVPNEVRDWLMSTFTRKISTAKDRIEKPKLRSVANAIRAGMFVERMRSVSNNLAVSIPPQVLAALRHIDDWTFDVFTLNEASNGQALRYVASEVLNHYDLLKKFKISSSSLENYLVAVEAGYSKYKNPYHNLVHAADVTQTTYWFLSQTGLSDWLSDLEIFACLIGAIIHDYEHTGTTNNFHVQSHSDLAMLYNDRSVLENYHISASFELMQKEEHGILSNLTDDQYREFRSLVIDMVLATDMSMHFKEMKNMKALLSMPENIDKSKALQMVIHSCDISHPAKPWPLHYRWTMAVVEEFFLQGDREQELGLPYSPLCDRHTTVIPHSQIGFIDFIVEPSMMLTGDMLEKILKPVNGDETEEDQLIPPTNGSNETYKAKFSNRSVSVDGAAQAKLAALHQPAKVSQQFKKPWIFHLMENKMKWKEEALHHVDGEQH